jgi:hypothetical protein
MQFNIKFIAAAALVAASPGMAATLSLYAGGDCSGLILGIFDNVQPYHALPTSIQQHSLTAHHVCIPSTALYSSLTAVSWYIFMYMLE